MTRRFAAYQATVFLGAFLLFQVQPMLAKALLPAYGGSYLVWGACMALYQAMLLAGYGAAHFLQRWLGVRRYALAHLGVLLVPLAFAPFDFAVFAQPVGEANLALSVVARVVVVAGAPFVVLAMASVLLQRWLSESGLPEAGNPYALYAASNLGSLLGLLSYPLLVEPLLDLRTQGWLWWAGYGLLALLHPLCLPRREAGRAEPLEAVPARQAGAWVLLSAAGSALLLAVTNRLTFDVSSAPFLWVLPLAVFLSTFVLAFKRVPWAPRWMPDAFAWALVLGVVLHLMIGMRLAVPALPALVLQLGILFIACMRCHGLLSALRPPDARQLTTFYLLLALGGALGGAAVSWIAPVATRTLAEVPLALAGAAVASGIGGALAAGRGSEARLAWRGVAEWRPSMATLLVVGAVLVVGPLALGRIEALPAAAIAAVVALAVALGIRRHAGRIAEAAAVIVAAHLLSPFAQQAVTGAEVLHRHRNFYGIYQVLQEDELRWLQHGTTNHGRQHTDPEREAIPLSYYHPSTPAGRALRSDAIPRARSAMIGLGTGALAMYYGEGDELVVYELDPDNEPIAEEWFSYLRLARAQGARISVHAGDGRLALADVEDGAYDLLVLDAFSSGAVPAHLLTTEAFAEYRRVVGDRGLVLMHISNRYLRLRPVVAAGAAATGQIVLFGDNAQGIVDGADYTLWAALAMDEASAAALEAAGLWAIDRTPPRELPRPWTDSFSNQVRALILF